MSRASRETLFDAGPAERRRPASTDLMVLPAGCPECGSPLTEVTAAQGVLFVHGGYGAPRQTTWRICTECWWSLEAETVEVHPRTWGR